MPMPVIDSEAVFWRKTDTSGECWHWLGAVDRDGYGLHREPHLNVKAHRYSAKLHGMDIENKLVCHKCDNPGCVNPDHLFVGTPLDNSRDMARKKRSHRWKLSDEQVLNIKKLLKTGTPKKDIAELHNVHVNTVYSINKNKTHRYVT